MKRLYQLLIGFSAALCPLSGWAQPLLPGDVARSAAENYPTVLAARAQRDVAEGRRLSALGAFDTQVESSVRSRLEGFYSGDIFDTKVSKPLGPWGAEIYGGYRIAQGDFPIYEDYAFTNEAGEGRVGVIFNLLRNRTTDSRRAGIQRGDLDVAEAGIDLLLTQLEVQQEALTAYWGWLTEARVLSIYEGLLEIAVSREEALQAQVQSGARAAIDLTENAQNVTRRRELVRSAEQDLELAAGVLSLYLRGEDGHPKLPEREQVPEQFELPQRMTTGIDLAQRPDLQLFDLARQKIEIDRALATNDQQPELRFSVESSSDFGAIGPGGISRDPAELIAGVQLKVPFGRRNAEGRLRSADAQLRVLEQERRLARDVIRQELANLDIAVQAAEDIVDLTRLESQQAQTLLDAELERFDNGASDFFLVNFREQTAANARIRQVEAERNLARLNIAWQAATLDLDSLRNGGSSSTDVSNEKFRR